MPTSVTTFKLAKPLSTGDSPLFPLGKPYPSWTSPSTSVIPEWRLPVFQGIPDYCAKADAMKWPSCPEKHSSLNLSDMFVAVLANSRDHMRRQVAAKALELQEARFQVFADPGSPIEERVVPLPVSGQLEQGLISRGFRDPRRFIGQKMLEMLVILRSFGPAKWWFLADDDTFIFIRRFREALERVPDRNGSIPMMLGDAHSQISLCMLGCNEVTRRAL